MAIDFFNRYPQNSGAKTPEYPFGSFRNETAPDAKDGTTLEQDWSNDWQAFFGKLLVEASMTPNGTVDTVVMSQYYDALLNLIRKERTKVSDILNGTQVDVASSENALRQAYELASAAVKKTGDTMTGDLILQNKLSLRSVGAPANNVGSLFKLENESGTLVIRRGRADGSTSGETRIVMPNKAGTVALEQDMLTFVGTGQDVMKTGAFGLGGRDSILAPQEYINLFYRYHDTPDDTAKGTFGVQMSTTANSFGQVGFRDYNLGELRYRHKVGNQYISGRVLTEQFNQQIGVGQSWVDVTNQRQIKVTYINSTTKPILVCVNGNESSISASVNNVSVSNGGSYSNVVSFIVPPGSSYYVDRDTEKGSLATWSELR